MTPGRARLSALFILGGVIVLLWAQPLLALRMLNSDLTIHLRWADQFHAALLEGQLLPRWAHASLDGLGDPTFVYYQPLFYYVDSVFLALGSGPQYALLLTSIASYALLAVLAWRTIAPRRTPGWALAGGVLLLCSPALLFIPTHMGFMPWTLGVPLGALFVMESVRPQPRPARLAVLLCLTALAHLLSALIALCCAALARLVLAGLARRALRPHLSWGAGAAVGLGLCAFFVYPAVTQMHLINPDGWTTGATYDWRAALLFPTFTHVRFGSRWMAFQWYLPVIVLGMALVAVSGRRQASDDAAFRLGVAALAALVLGSELAYPLYAWVGPMQKLQFPYRFMPMAAVLATLAFVLRLADGGWRHAGMPLRALVLALVAATCAQALFVQWSLYRHGERMPARATYMSGRFGQTEYLLAARGPHWEDYIAAGKLAGECARLQIRCAEPAPRLSHAYTAVIETPRPVTLRLPVFAYPAWGVRVDGQTQALRLDPDTGLVRVDLAPGRHDVGLHWAGLPAERIGRWLSLAALLALGLMLAAARRAARRSGGRAHPAPAAAPVPDEALALADDGAGR